MNKMLILGATSAIAEATARCFAAQGAALFLVGRNAQHLAAIAADLQLRGASQVLTQTQDLLTTEQHPQLIADVVQQLGGLDTVLIAYGQLPDQIESQASFDQTKAIFELNLLSVISLLIPLTAHFEAQRAGSIAVIASVAGDRGRQSNYLYGAAKGALSIFLQGLRNRLSAVGVQVLTIKPGFVDTPMTADFPKGSLWATPAQVAVDIERAIRKRHHVLYTPWFWRWIMLIIRLIPESLFKRLKL